ncbi:hypothetical protein ACIRON_03165 [Nocardioides sp. NPDC101246]|uniref:hypothetical protein n=1 Tax=Nocardioides sp. NPDC101246 TaxID=3364336 RepID=UPI0038149F3C
MATKALKDAVDYTGSSVAFIQLMAAMERDGELEREVRGKRTYSISLVSPAAGSGRAFDLPPSTDQTGVDYAALARALLHELTSGDAPVGLAEMRAENKRIARERDEYARRLETARALLEELRDSARSGRG